MAARVTACFNQGGHTGPPLQLIRRIACVRIIFMCHPLILLLFMPLFLSIQESYLPVQAPRYSALPVPAFLPLVVCYFILPRDRLLTRAARIRFAHKNAITRERGRLARLFNLLSSICFMQDGIAGGIAIRLAAPRQTTHKRQY